MIANRAPLEERLRLAQQKLTTATTRAAEFEGRARRTGNFRGLSFVFFLFSIGGAFSAETGSRKLLAWTLALVGLALFLWLITVHDKELNREAEENRRIRVQANRLLRLNGKSVELSDTGSDLSPAAHAYAGDLDIFGRGSLFQHVSVAHTDFGRRLLASWFTTPTAVQHATHRQAATLELATQQSFRDELEQSALGLLARPGARSRASASTPDPAPLLAWIESPPELLGKAAFAWGRRLIPACTVAGAIGAFAFGLPNAAWIVPWLMGLTLLFRTSQHNTQAFLAVSHSEGTFLPYGTLLEKLETLDVQAQYLKDLKAELFGSRDQNNPSDSEHPKRNKPSQAMKRFRNIVYWYEIRHNGMLYPFLDSVFLWSLNCTFALEAWKKALGPTVRRWFEVIAEFEALSSLANLLADDDDATLPTLVSEGEELGALALGHPLIRSNHRVKNDLPNLSAAQALLVTGSNMSGKSTFLRALGVNVVLGSAGGPVIAHSMRLPRLTLGTSLRISDSLLDQTSHFLAEVKKLAAICAAATVHDGVLFLLDEVLHGTNSRERQIGARWLLRDLLSHHARGILTTHDEGLCQLEGELAHQVRLFHFREDVSQGHMTFDYKLRTGPVTSGNALRVMRAVGLAVPLDDAMNPSR